MGRIRTGGRYCEIQIPPDKTLNGLGVISSLAATEHFNDVTPLRQLLYAARKKIGSRVTCARSLVGMAELQHRLSA
jgi:hypothetical protein